MKFLNYEHELQFSRLKEEMPERFYNDRERLAVVFLMAGNKELERKMKPYIDWEEGFFFDEMFENEDFSSGLKVLAKLAVILFNNGVSLEFHEFFTRLDETNLQLGLSAANYRYDISPKGIYEQTDTNSYLK